MKTLSTLGPKGSDSEHAAHIIQQQLGLATSVVLLESFAAALEHAGQNDGVALVPAAYQEIDGAGRKRTSWADLHFRIEAEGQLELWTACVLPLKQFVIARRREVGHPRSVALHAAMSYYAHRFLPDLLPHYYRSKPDAVRACVAGYRDACIGSLDIIQPHLDQLEIIRSFAAHMCWTLYRKRAAARGRQQ